MFIVGNRNITNKLQEEQLEHKDIFFLDCNDGYFDLSDKVHFTNSNFRKIYEFYDLTVYFFENSNILTIA
jgi:hypothetical protein